MTSHRLRSRITDEQIIGLVSKLQTLVPEACIRSGDGASTFRVLQETCNYIRSLQQEVNDLSSRLSELLSETDISSDQAVIIRSVFM